MPNTLAALQTSSARVPRLTAAMPRYANSMTACTSASIFSSITSDFFLVAKVYEQNKRRSGNSTAFILKKELEYFCAHAFVLWTRASLSFWAAFAKRCSEICEQRPCLVCCSVQNEQTKNMASISLLSEERLHCLFSAIERANVVYGICVEIRLMQQSKLSKLTGHSKILTSCMCFLSASKQRTIAVRSVDRLARLYWALRATCKVV